MYALKGYNKFKQDKLASYASKMDELKSGQQPPTLFITCSDSRIMPNEMTSTTFGELFVIRNAGNTIPAAAKGNGNADAATLEYGVKALKVKEIVVCGHSSCGAIGALISGVPQDQLPFVHSYLAELENLKFEISKEGLDLKGGIMRNIKTQMQNVLSYSFVKEAVDRGELSVSGWYYNIENGEVELVE